MFSLDRILEYVKVNCNESGQKFVVRFTPQYQGNYPDINSLFIARYAVYAMSIECTLGKYYNCDLNLLAGYQDRYKNNYSYEIASDYSYIDIKCGNAWDTVFFLGWTLGTTVSYVDWYD